MKAPTEATTLKLNQEQLNLVNGGYEGEDNLSPEDIMKTLLSPLIKIAKKLIGPFLPPTFEEFYALIQKGMGYIEKEIGNYDWKVKLAFKAYKALPESWKRTIWKAVYDALKAQMPMAR